MKSLFRSKRSGADQANPRKGPGIYKHKDELRHLLLSCKSYFVTVMVFSCAINLLYLAGPLYMLQVYDRVVSSGSIVTLVMLTLVLLLAFAALAALDTVRGRILARASTRLDQQMAGRVITAIVDASLKTEPQRPNIFATSIIFASALPAPESMPFLTCPGRRSTLP
jgi:ATP-binding cassette subfamily C protein